MYIKQKRYRDWKYIFLVPNVGSLGRINTIWYSNSGVMYRFVDYREDFFFVDGFQLSRKKVCI